MTCYASQPTPIRVKKEFTDLISQNIITTEAEVNNADDLTTVAAVRSIKQQVNILALQVMLGVP